MSKKDGSVFPGTYLVPQCVAIWPLVPRIDNPNYIGEWKPRLGVAATAVSSWDSRLVKFENHVRIERHIGHMAGGCWGSKCEMV